MKVDNKSEAKRDPFPVGMHQAVCYSIIDLGHQEYDYLGETKVARKVQISFEVPAIRFEGEKDGEKIEGPRVIGKEYTASLGEKANLRKDLISWRSKDFTQEELDGFELSKLLGVNCLLNVALNDKKTYSKIVAITPLMKGQETIKAENPHVNYEIGMAEAFPDGVPQWLRDKILKAKEFQGIDETVSQEADQRTEQLSQQAEPEDDDSDDLPF